MAYHLFQPVISMGARFHTFSGHLTWTSGGEAPSRWREAGLGAESSALSSFRGFTTKI